MRQTTLDPYYVRKSTLRLWKMLSLAGPIKPILNKIQLFKNLKLEREMYVLDCQTHPLDVHKLFPLVSKILFCRCFLNGCTSFNIDPINAKLENVANFNMLTFWQYRSRVVYPIINQLVPSPSQYETSKWSIKQGQFVLTGIKVKHNSSLPMGFFAIITVKPCFTDNFLIRTPCCYDGQFSLFLSL